jgi:hypothetical protein
LYRKESVIPLASDPDTIPFKTFEEDHLAGELTWNSFQLDARADSSLPNFSIINGDFA